ncbi:ABC transporter permease [Naasia lichenicola]|uniref:ABC transporter permease n=1 Tax=Naasia lichenicola TaxID=2565933 RepID=A0A4S4FJJ4_9MICO|nr:ABC transporter permease [Naasia lichenicola]THG29306.1 ABC transporter permease [Naasia lichenicola]
MTATTAAPQTATTRLSAYGTRIGRSRNALTAGVLLAICILFTILSPYFLTQANWLNTSTTMTQILLLGLGQTFVIISRGIDLSVGANLSLSGMVAGAFMTGVLAPYESVGEVPSALIGAALAIGTGLLVGIINGLLIAFLRIPAFVATLGMLGVCSGASYLLTNGQSLSGIPTAIGTAGNYNILGWIPVPVIVTAIVVAVAIYVLSQTRFGERTYMLGDNPDAVVRAGINDRRHLVAVYAISGALAGLAAIIAMGRLASASPTAGANAELQAIATVVIGGASLYGGRGTIFGTVLGAAIVTVLLTGLIIIQVPPFWQVITVGVVLITAVFLDQQKELRAAKR